VAEIVEARHEIVVRLDAREYMGKRLTRDWLDGVDIVSMHVENALG